MLANIQNFIPFGVLSILCAILSTCLDPSHIHPKELSSTFVRHTLLPPLGVNIGMGVYLATS
ncbi:BgtTE-56101 [Blumeria graminis f. sp. tritici]|uniref:BgtTE-56101 n=1 Tax=Blumeria graminis f. sp. tritici TaxID=62690 RepID=A0A9X9QF78_BLUGR|nr:BgtTE-56101 [Blumeria graminis f. sp. tritici]